MLMNRIGIDSNTDQKSALLRPTDVEGTTCADMDLSVLTSFEEVQEEGEPDFVVELIDLYLEDTPRRIAAMKATVMETDAMSLKRAAHSLRGSSANLGARRMAALCDELEHVDGNDSVQKTSALLSGLEQEFERVRLAFLDERQRRL